MDIFVGPTWIVMIGSETDILFLHLRRTIRLIAANHSRITEMALRLQLTAFEAPPLVLNRIPFRSLSFLSGPSIRTFSPPQRIRRRKPSFVLAAIRKDETELSVPGLEVDVEIEGKTELNASGELEEYASPEDLEYIGKIKRVLELLKKNRDMLFGEVHEGKIPKNRVALRLADELISWPDLEVEAPKTKLVKSLYARATDTGVDPREAAKRLNIDWDSAADIEAKDEDEDIEVPPAVGYGALYLVTALPIIIGVSVILVLFFNSLQ